MAHNCVLKEFACAIKERKRCRRRNQVAQLVRLSALSSTLLFFVREEFARAASNNARYESEAGIALSLVFADTEGIPEHAAARILLPAEEHEGWHVGEEYLVGNHNGPNVTGRAARAEAFQLPGEVTKCKLTGTTTDPCYPLTPDERRLQKQHSFPSVRTGRDGAASLPAPVTVNAKRQSTRNKKNNATLCNSPATRSFFGKLSCKDQVLLLAKMLQSVYEIPQVLRRHPLDVESVLRQLHEVLPSSQDTHPAQINENSLHKANVAQALHRHIEGAIRGIMGDEMKQVGAASARTITAVPQTALVSQSVSPVTAPFQTASPGLVTPLSTSAPSVRLPELPQSSLSSSLSTAYESPSYQAVSAFGSPSYQAAPSFFPLAPSHSNGLPSSAQPGHLGSDEGATPSPILTTYLSSSASAAFAGNNPVAPGAENFLYYSPWSIKNLPHASEQIKRSSPPAAYLPSAVLASPLISGPLSPTIVGGTVSSAVGTALGQTTQLVDDTLRSAIVHVINPVTYSATSLLQGIQAVNHKLQVGSEVATKALLDFAAYRKSHPQDSLAEFVNTLEEVTNTLNKAATTAPDPRLHNKDVAHSQVVDSAAAESGELLEGMQSDLDATSFRKENSTTPAQHLSKTGLSQQTNSTAAERLEQLGELQQPPSLHRLGANQNSTVHGNFSLPAETTQHINLRDVLSAEQVRMMEILTSVLNTGFDAALGFVKRQERGVAGLKQFPFFQPLQQRIIQAAYRAGERAAAERAASDRKAAVESEPTMLRALLYGTHQGDHAYHISSENQAKGKEAPAPLPNPQSRFWATPPTARASPFHRDHFVQRQGATPRISLPSSTTLPTQALPPRSMVASEQIHLKTYPLAKHQGYHLGQPDLPATFASNIPPHEPMQQRFANDPQRQPDILHISQPFPMPHMAALRRVPYPKALHRSTLGQQVRIRPNSPADLLQKGDASQQQHQVLQHPRTPAPDGSTVYPFKKVFARRLNAAVRRNRRVRPITRLILPAMLNALVHDHQLQMASGERPTVSVADIVRDLKATSDNGGLAGDVAPEQRSRAIHREDTASRRSLYIGTTNRENVSAQAPYTKAAMADRSVTQTVSTSSERMSPDAVDLATPSNNSAFILPTGARDATDEKPPKKTEALESFVAAAQLDQSDRLENGPAIDAYRLQSLQAFTADKQTFLPHADGPSRALHRSAPSKIPGLSHRFAFRDKRPFLFVTDSSPTFSTASLDSESFSLSNVDVPMTGGNTIKIRRLAHRGPLVSAPAAVDAAAAAAVTLPTAAAGVPVSPTPVGLIMSRAGLQEKCVLSGVRYKGLASVVDRRTSFGTCQAACRAAAAAAAVAARSQPSISRGPSIVRDGSLGSRTVMAGKPDEIPCSFTSYLAEVGLCYRYPTVEGLLPAPAYTSAPITCSIIEAGKAAGTSLQHTSPAQVYQSQHHAFASTLETSRPQVLQSTVNRQLPLPPSPPGSALGKPPMQRSLPQEYVLPWQMGPKGGNFSLAPLSFMSSRGSESPQTAEQPASTYVVQHHSSPASAIPIESTTPTQKILDLAAETPFFTETDSYNASPLVPEGLARRAIAQHTLFPVQHDGSNDEPNFGPFPSPTDRTGTWRNSGEEMSGNGWAGTANGEQLLFSSNLHGLQFTNQQPEPPGGVPSLGFPFTHDKAHDTLAEYSSSPVGPSTAEILPSGASSVIPSAVGHAVPPVAVSSVPTSVGVPLVPLRPPPPPITALSALPSLPSITTPIAGTASSILQTAQGLMQTGNALMQAFPLQQLLDAGQQLYASGFFRNRGMKHLQLPFLGQQKQELPPPPGMEKPTVTCATEGMTCCVPENAAEKWKEHPPYLNNRDWDKKCRAHFVSITNSLCTTTSYVLKGRGRQTEHDETQSAADAKPLSTLGDQVDNCGLILTETRDFWVFRHTLVIPGRSMNNAICECKEPKAPNQEQHPALAEHAVVNLSQCASRRGLRQIEGFATWEFSLQAVHDMEAQAERGEKIAKGLGTALALTTVLGRQGEEALGHMLEHTNPSRA